MKKRTFYLLLLTLIAVSIAFVTLSPTTDVFAGEIRDYKLQNAIVLQINNPNSIVGNQIKYVDSNNLNVMPFMIEEKAMVPLRFISEYLKAKVEWQPEENKIVIRKETGEVAQLVIGQKEFTIDGKIYQCEVAPILENGRAFVPIRVISEELFQKEVFWDDGLIIISDIPNIFDLEKEQEYMNEIYNRIGILPKIRSYEELLYLLKENPNYGYFEGDRNESFDLSDSSSAIPSENAMTGKQEAEADYSKTNVQVDDVDEADIVKTDGKYIYQVNQNKIVILKAYPAENMEIVKEIKYDTIASKQNSIFYPKELYINSRYLVVIGNSYIQNKDITSKDMISSATSNYYLPYYQKSATCALVYDLNTYECVREVMIEGNYHSSRMIKNSIYFITNQNVYYRNGGEILPIYFDSVIGDSTKTINVTDICYFPGFEQPNYLMIAGINLDKMKDEVSISTFLGASNNLYATTEHFYVAQNQYHYIPFYYDSVMQPARKNEDEVMTNIYKFALSDGKVKYLAKGEVKGTILNQFSMDENKGYFRIATTTGQSFNDTSANHLFVLDKNMNLVGRIEGIAKGEQIYSTRFMKDRCYMVTFKTVDPLFVIDLSKPDRPTILGELKIPGYSDYLHPYDENHILGFGKDTITKVEKNWKGEEVETAYEVGMKMAMFDVSDVNNPKEKFSTKIGDRGTYSELLYNHKALLFDKERDILAFPITIAESKELSYNGIPSYGKTTFQGAIIFGIDLKDGFTLKGKIAHYDANINQDGYYVYDSTKQVERILYIKDTLYTLSKGMVKANDIQSMKEIKSIEIEQERAKYWNHYDRIDFVEN